MNKPEGANERPTAETRDEHEQTLREHVDTARRNITNLFTVERQYGLADGAGAPGSTAAGDNRAGIPHEDEQRGDRD